MTPEPGRGPGYTNPEAALGGADAVEKTTYVTGHGTEPEGRTNTPDAVVARARAGGGINPLLWVVILVAVLIAVVYGFGLLT